MRFNNEDFDGVVIMIPNSFIEMDNSIIEPLETLGNILLNSRGVSFAHPQKDKNNNEIFERASKKNVLAAIKNQELQRKQDSIDKAEKLRIDILNKDAVKFLYRPHTVHLGDCFKFRGKEYKVEEIFTNKGNFKAEYKKELLIETDKDLREFFDENLLKHESGCFREWKFKMATYGWAMELLLYKKYLAGFVSNQLSHYRPMPYLDSGSVEVCYTDTIYEDCEKTQVGNGKRVFKLKANVKEIEIH